MHRYADTEEDRKNDAMAVRSNEEAHAAFDLSTEDRIPFQLEKITMKTLFLKAIFFCTCVVAVIGPAYALYCLAAILWRLVVSREAPEIFELLFPGLMIYGSFALFQIGRLSLRASMTDAERFEHEADMLYIMWWIEAVFSRRFGNR